MIVCRKCIHIHKLYFKNIHNRQQHTKTFKLQQLAKHANIYSQNQ